MAALLFLSAFLLCFLGTLGEEINLSRCPSNLKRDDYLHTHKDRCFEFVIYRTRTWSQAEKECEHTGGKLVTDNDASTHEFLVSKLKAHQYAGNGVWIGLTDKRRENYYKWVSGESLQFTKWAPGQPSKFFHAFEDCVFMSKVHGYSWDDHRCEIVSHYGYICEYKMLAPSTSTITTSTTTTTTTTTTPPTTNTPKPTTSTTTTTPTTVTTTIAPKITTTMPAITSTTIPTTSTTPTTITTKATTKTHITKTPHLTTPATTTTTETTVATTAATTTPLPATVHSTKPSVKATSAKPTKGILTSVNVAGSTTKIPVKTTEIPTTVKKIPAKTTMKPAKTTMKAAKTTKIPVTTTMMPAKTTVMPAKTTMKPTKTTTIPVTTTMMPAKTTTVPATTIKIVTTGKPATPAMKSPTPASATSGQVVTGAVKGTTIKA